MDRSAFQCACQELGLVVTESQIDEFEEFENALYEANQRTNLTRIPKEDCWLRHFIDSLLIAEFIPKGSEVLDIGTGPGFPAWPLACARPDLKVTGLDSNGKMLSFLRSQPLTNLKVVQGRAENDPPRERFDVVTGRALAPLPIQLEISAAPCRIGGFVVPMRTPKDEPIEMSDPRLGLEQEGRFLRRLPGTDIIRLVPLYQKKKATDRRFPRTWAEMRR